MGSGKSADTSGDERNPTDQSGAGVDQEESGDKSSSNKGLENSDGESADGTLESLESGNLSRRPWTASMPSPISTAHRKHTFFFQFSVLSACTPRLAQRVYFARFLIFRRNLRLLAILLILRAITKLSLNPNRYQRVKTEGNF